MLIKFIVKMSSFTKFFFGEKDLVGLCRENIQCCCCTLKLYFVEGKAGWKVGHIVIFRIISVECRNNVVMKIALQLKHAK